MELDLLFTFHFVIFLWIFFRADSFDIAEKIIYQIIFDMNFNFAFVFFENRIFWIILVITGFLISFLPEKFNKKMQISFVKSPYLIKAFIFLIIVQLVIQFQSKDVQPFIYFQF